MREYKRYYHKNEKSLTVLYEFESENEMNLSGFLQDPRRTTCFMSDEKYYVGGHFDEQEAQG
jgi:hypothetical protein